MERKDGMTPEEGVVMDHLVEAVIAFRKLPREHPTEAAEFVVAVHACTSLLAVRLARRTHPEGWPTYEDESLSELR